MGKMTVEEFLEHNGVKGMKWGVRKEEERTGAPGSAAQKQPMSKKKKAAIVLGSAALAAGIALGAYYVHKKLNLNVNLSDIKVDPKKTALVSEYAKAMADEPLSLVHFARGKHVVLGFPQKGGLTDPVHELNQAFGGNHELPPGTFRRYGEHLDKVAGIFSDPEGRKDFAGRAIFHTVVLPKEMADGVTDIDQLQAVAWPQMKDSYNALYNLTREQYKSGGKIVKSE